MTEEEAAEKHGARSRHGMVTQFMQQLDVDEDVAVVLLEEGFTSLEEIAYVPIDEMVAIEGFDLEIVEELRSRARNTLTTMELVGETNRSSQEPAEDLLTMEGMTKKLAYDLAEIGIITMEDLAEQAIDDLMDIESMTEALAGEIIMTARAPWFE